MPLQRNTKKRIEILENLRSGGFLESHIGGWYEGSLRGGAKLREETRDWLEATGELVEVKEDGRHIRSYRIYHRDKVPTGFEARKVAPKCADSDCGEVTHGGKREGAGRKPSPSGRSVPKSIKVSRDVADYLSEVGTGVIEDMIRKTKAFRVWKASTQSN